MLSQSHARAATRKYVQEQRDSRLTRQRSQFLPIDARHHLDRCRCITRDCLRDAWIDRYCMNGSDLVHFVHQSGCGS